MIGLFLINEINTKALRLDHRNPNNSSRNLLSILFLLYKNINLLIIIVAKN